MVGDASRLKGGGEEISQVEKGTSVSQEKGTAYARPPEVPGSWEELSDGQA